MANLSYKPVVHDRQAFLARASKRKGFAEAYEALELEYQLANQMLKARSRAGLTQDAVAERMGATKRALFPGSSLLAKSMRLPLLHFSATRRRSVATCGATTVTHNNSVKRTAVPLRGSSAAYLKRYAAEPSVRHALDSPYLF